VRQPYWTQQATPGNSQLQNGLSLSQDRNEADCGVESGNPSGNSRLQREQLGGGQAGTSSPTPRSAETGDRKSVKYASLDDDGQVILFVSSDSDVPDATETRQNENRNRPVSANKQSESSENKGDKSAKNRESSRNKDENSADRKSAEQTEKTRKSSKKQAVSSEKVSKEERGRSASKKRHRRSSSESRSPSSDKGHKGGKGRSEKLSEALPSSSRKKSQRQVPNGDKVVPVTSSDDSSSESENDKSGRTNIESRSKHVLKPP